MNKLLIPININNKLELHNRLVMPPMATFKTNDGSINDVLLKYYDEKTCGGYIGLVITEYAYISKEGKAGNGQVSICDDSCIEGFKKLTSIIHKNGSKVICQINHAGSNTSKSITGMNVLGPSALPLPNKTSIPQEMTIDDINKVKDDFIKAALRAKEAGFDGVELHSAHAYLLNQFYSPLTNKRSDEYNGYTLEGRIKLHLDIIKEVRKAVGDDFVLAIRLGACDYIENGTSIDDSVKACIEFEKAGVDLIDISGELCGGINPYNKEQGYFQEISIAVKNKINIPVILTGGIIKGTYANKLLEDNKAVLIGVGRAILKDSSWAKNAIEELR
jgi:NADPH2 dehydrogenase